MAIEVKHNFQSAKADSADASLIRPSSWNEAHKVIMGTAALVGRYTAGTGDAQEVGLGNGLQFTAGTLVVNQSQLTQLARLDGADFTGQVTALTQATANDTTRVATTAYVKANFSARLINAGFGMEGGGDLSANRTITLGLPSTLSASSSNDVSGYSHTHAVNTLSVVQDGTKQIGAGAVGSYAMLYTQVNSVASPDDVRSGGNLNYADADGGTGASPGGSWRCMSRSNAGTLGTRVSLWVRIS